MDFKDFDFGSLTKMPPDFSKSMRGINEATRRVNESFEEASDYARKKNEAVLDTAEALRQMNAKMDAERQARIEAEEQAKIQRKTDKRFAITGITIGLLTLIATVLLGILG